YKWSRSSEFTEKKAKTDRERDRILKGITDLLYAYEKHCDPSLRNNAFYANYQIYLFKNN
ncbi:MAG: hypothetical protein LBG45_11045, partial [Dysgonamonadaceae bacterium]|nr:hypothetical protein [Dysgonamonadaceae bacterium]